MKVFQIFYVTINVILMLNLKRVTKNVEIAGQVRQNELNEHIVMSARRLKFQICLKKYVVRNGKCHIETAPRFKKAIVARDVSKVWFKDRVSVPGGSKYR